MLVMSRTRRFLAIAAHPDDLDFGAAGTTAHLTSEGNEVIYCLTTSGEAGGSDHSMSRTDMAAVRHREQTEAASVVGVSELHFLDHPDGALLADLVLRRELTRVIRQVRPDVVIGQSPERDLDRIFASHPDHLATGEATMCAVYPDSRNPFAFPELLDDEGLEPHTVPEVWLMAHPRTDFAVDITETFDRKVSALARHRSQIDDIPALEKRLRDRCLEIAQEHGLGPGRLAEAFRQVRTVL